MRIKRWKALCMGLFLTLALAIPTCAAEKEKLDPPAGVTLDEEGATWEEVEVSSNKTVKYEVQLFRGSSKYIASKSTSDLWVSFDSTIAKYGTGNYRVRVRAICSGYTTSSWSDKSDDYFVDSDLLEQYREETGVSGSESSGSSASTNSSNYNFNFVTNSSTSSGNNTTTQKKRKSGWYQDRAGWWYVDDKGIVAAHEWKKIDGKWYYFGGNGYMLTGWLNDKGVLYYLDGTGAMVTGSREIGGVTYQFDANGAKQ